MAFWIMPGADIAWPFGLDGGLHITNGQTVTLTPGQAKDYSSIQIDAGGTLHVNTNQVSGGWVFIGCAGSFICNGTISIKGDTSTGGTYPATAPDNVAVSYTVLQQSGGSGGSGGGAVAHSGGGANQSCGGGGGGSQAFGNGGGGGSGAGNTSDTTCSGGFGGGNASQTFGGDGAAGFSNCGGNPSGGSGAALTGNTGGSGSGGFFCGGACWLPTGGGGGGGGTRGYHGMGLYLKVRGSISGTGTIDVSGQNGGSGGNGGSGLGGPCNAAPDEHSGSGGQGGGGAGGSGGQLIFKYRGTAPVGLNLTASGGTAGAGGSGAQNGVAGTVTLQSW